MPVCLRKQKPRMRVKTGAVGNFAALQSRRGSNSDAQLTHF
jgi:hypothetical protein